MKWCFSLQDFNKKALFLHVVLQGGLRGDDPETTLTAFVLIALAEAKQADIRCADPNVDVEVNHTRKRSAELVASNMSPRCVSSLLLRSRGIISSCACMNCLSCVSAVVGYAYDGRLPEESSGAAEETLHCGHRLVRSGSDGESSTVRPDRLSAESVSCRYPGNSALFHLDCTENLTCEDCPLKTFEAFIGSLRSCFVCSVDVQFRHIADDLIQSEQSK